jgi:hypothetical protein
MKFLIQRIALRAVANDSHDGRRIANLGETSDLSPKGTAAFRRASPIKGVRGFAYFLAILDRLHSTWG